MLSQYVCCTFLYIGIFLRAAGTRVGAMVPFTFTDVFFHHWLKAKGHCLYPHW